MISIRPLREEDLPALVALYDELYPVPTDRDTMRKHFRQMALNPDYRVAGAFTANGELVGSALVIICLEILAGCQPWAMIENVIVTQRLRGEGVGRMLLHDLEQFARQRGCSYIQLTTTSPSAYGFYTAVGYSGDVVKAFRKTLSQS